MNKEQILKKKKRRKIHRNRVLALMSVFLFIVGITFIEIRANNASLHDSQKLLQEKTAALDKVKNKNENLKITVKELKDKDYIKKWIRSKYFYSKDGETIYNFGSN
ncbi:FtsB family cell division protein [Xylocopilactobacillus apicola]|uniref:Septum formation initiator n=1 Tax=Xylocopilactobacillus apicola TaxID=2932184 RepID=A0AAU9CWJ1_9LACO|nr:septum formation initiator family protein [Xylocopilactobacillus apicola]BDR58334.1 hypothetical protein XA3_07750 [Xylocopilactobacillus apicola]